MQIVINSIIAGSLAALIAGGLAVVYGVLGVFNLALGQLALIGGYATWWLHTALDAPLAISIIGGLIISGLISWFAFEVFVNPFYRRHRFLPLITTIALSMIIDAAILLLFGERSRDLIDGPKQSLDLGGVFISVEQIWMIGLTVLVLISFAYVFHATAVGRKIRAVVQNEFAARSLGIPAPLLHRIVFIISGLLAACGGIYLGIDTSLTPTLAFSITIAAYAAVIAGGKGNIWGAVACAYLIAFIERIAVSIEWADGITLPAGYQKTIALLFIIVLLLYRPHGLFASSTRTA